MFFDLAGALISFISTYYFIRLNNKAWPVGLLATILNGGLYWYKGIYADMLLEVFYCLSMCYGWYQWRKSNVLGSKSQRKALAYLNQGQWLFLSLVLGLVFISIYYLLQTLTHSDVALLDAATTSLSLVAQWLMCHKIMATWILWFITDLLYALMYMGKSLPFHSGLMIVYMGMALIGYLNWRREISLRFIKQPLQDSLSA